MTCKLASRLFVTVSVFSVLSSRPAPSDAPSAVKASSEGEFGIPFISSPSSIMVKNLNIEYVNMHKTMDN